MAIIECEIVINSPVLTVWEIISDLDSEPKFWKGTKSITNKHKDGNKITREIVLAFRDSVCEQLVTLDAPTKITTNFTRGIIKGSKIIQIMQHDNSTVRLIVIWDIAMTGMMSIFTSIITRHVRSGTESALEAIKIKAESQ